MTQTPKAPRGLFAPGTHVLEWCRDCRHFTCGECPGDGDYGRACGLPDCSLRREQAPVVLPNLWARLKHGFRTWWDS